MTICDALRLPRVFDIRIDSSISTEGPSVENSQVSPSVISSVTPRPCWVTLTFGWIWKRMAKASLPDRVSGLPEGVMKESDPSSTSPASDRARRRSWTMA